ncbi:MAG: DUF1206 domain-containing protein [Hyphomicrobiaceae bacterium]
MPKASLFGPLARAGYASRGLIYVVIGFFAALAAVGGGEAMGSKDALTVVLASTGGNYLAVLLAAGLVFYALWRFTQASFDLDGHGTRAKGLAIRAGMVASGVAYGTLASYAVSLMRGADDGGSGGEWAAALTGFVGERLVAGALAAVLVGVGIAHFMKAWRERYVRYLEADYDKMRIIHPIAKVGLCARGIVFLVPAFLLATRTARGGENASTKAALEFVQDLPGGWLLLSLMGVGLMAFAAYSFIQAVYRRVNIEDARI